jgi:hypothetical protein
MRLVVVQAVGDHPERIALAGEGEEEGVVLVMSVVMSVVVSIAMRHGEILTE